MAKASGDLNELQTKFALWNVLKIYHNARLALLFTNASRSIHDSLLSIHDGKAVNSFLGIIPCQTVAFALVSARFI